MTVLQLFTQYLPYLFQAAGSIQEIFDYIQKVKTALQQSGEWTPEAEEAFNQELQNLKDNPPDWWKPEQT